MKLHERTLLQLIILAALERSGRLTARLLRTVQGVIRLNRSWRAAWILAERK